MAMIHQDGALLRSFIQTTDEQHLRKRESVREAIKSAATPIPSEVVHNLAQLSPHDARDVLRDHPGFSLREKRSSYEMSFRLFERSVEDLIRAIENFEELLRDGTIFDRRGEKSLYEIEGAVQKELFATTNAAHALVDHSTRRLQKDIQISGYDQRRSDCFGDDGLHEFVIGLRTIIHHIQMVRPGWQVTHQFAKGNRQAAFNLNRDELLSMIQGAKDKMNASGRRYLKNAPEKIDLQHVFEEYRRRATEFHAWFSRALEAQPLEDVRDYDRCLRENRKYVARTFWKAMIGNWLKWDQPPDPYNHLDRYLTADQLANVYILPMRSREQVDGVIEFLDTDGACDDELRHLAYQLFRCASL